MSFVLSEEGRRRFLDRGELVKRLGLCQTLQEIGGWTNEQLNRAYTAAKKLLEEERYDELCDVCLVLLVINPLQSPLWWILGLAEQGRGRFAMALAAYRLAALGEEEGRSPLLYYHVAKCHYALEDRKRAACALDQARELADEGGGDPEVFRWIVESQKFLRRLEAEE